MTTSATPRQAQRAGRAPSRWPAWAAAVAVVGGALVITALPAAAESGQGAETSSVQITPEPAETGGSGSATCAALTGTAASGTWQELRFAALPDVGGSASTSAAGASATVTRSSAGTASFVSSAGVALVVVGAAPGQAADGATFRYDPPARGASGLSGRDPASPIGSVLLCVAQLSPSPSPATASEAATVAAARPAMVRARTIARTTASAAPARAQSAAPALPRLPETGAGTLTLVFAGLSLIGLGAVAVAAVAVAGRARRLALQG